LPFILLLDASQATVESMASMKENILSIVDQSKDFPTQVAAEVKKNPLGAAKASATVTTNIKAIVCFSQSGQTVSLVARERARVPVIALTPLMSITNAISAIAVVGSIIVTGSDYPMPIRVMGAIALFASMTNIVSGFLITYRMLKMFKTTRQGEQK